MTANEEYFAARDGRDLVDELESFGESWDLVVGGAVDQGLGSVWYRNVRYYYSNIFDGNGSDSGLGYAGEQGELISMVVPQARSLNTQFLSLTTKQKLNFVPEAVTSDTMTMSSNRMADGIIDKTLVEQSVDSKAYVMAELGSLMGSSYIWTTWDHLLGKYQGSDPETGENLFTGGLRWEVASVYEMRYDHTIQDFSDNAWVERRVARNRYDLIAKFPLMKPEILSLPSVNDAGRLTSLWQEHLGKDMVWVREFYHKTTAALPMGRLVIFSDSDTIYFDNENPYQIDGEAFIPCSQFKPEPIVGSGFGYPIFSNILPLQEMLDHNISAQASNNAAFAIKSVLNPAGNDINVKHIANMKFLTYTPLAGIEGGGRPSTLDLNTPNPELSRFSDQLMSHMMQIYNINGTLRGEPPAGVTAASAIATLSVNALEFSQNFIKSYVFALQRAMTCSVYCYRIFAPEGFLVDIAGPRGSKIAKDFKTSDLATFKRVKIGIANPLMATSAGKFEVANNLLKTGLVTNPNKYFRILEGAPIEDLFDEEYSQDEFIQSENDELRKPDEENPSQVFSLATDDHPAHIRGHHVLLDDIEMRNDPVRRQRIEDHIASHYEMAKSTDPFIMQMIKTGQMPEGMAQGAQQGAPPDKIPQGSDAPVPQATAGGVLMPAAPARPSGSIENADMGGLTPSPLEGMK